MRILVTGSAGFIGYHTVLAFIDKGWEVVGIDNINDYYDVGLKYARLNNSGVPRSKIVEYIPVQSTLHQNYTFINVDITEGDKLEEIFSSYNFDYVVHLAAQAGVRYSLTNPHAYVQSNIVGFMNMLECSRKYHIKHLVYASSSSVYGGNKKIPFSEDQKVDEPVSIYAASKKSNELMAFTYSHLYNIATTGLRFFTVYGPWGRPDMAPMLFASAILRGDAIKIFNHGDMKRDFTYIDDIVEGITKLTTCVKKEGGKAEILNIGNSSPVDLLDFVTGMEAALGVESKKEFLPMQDGDVRVTYADTSKLEDLIGYKPSTKLKEGLEEFVKWYRNYYSK